MTQDPGTSGGSPRHPGSSLCSPFVDALGVGGASISVFGFGGQQVTICATDTTAARVESLQFELGEGPHWDAMRTGLPVLCPNLDNRDPDLWPVFASAARDLDVAAVFAFPMTIGAASIGAVDLYCATPRRLDAHQVSLASSMAGRVATAAVRAATDLANEASGPDTGLAPSLRREVHQAIGMIQAQLGTTASDAFARLRAHAFSTGQPVEHVALDVVAKRLDFSTITD